MTKLYRVSHETLLSELLSAIETEGVHQWEDQDTLELVKDPEEIITNQWQMYLDEGGEEDELLFIVGKVSIYTTTFLGVPVRFDIEDEEDLMLISVGTGKIIIDDLVAEFGDTAEVVDLRC